jgi:galactose-1-phosphate uridylyltransferase
VFRLAGDYSDPANAIIAKDEAGQHNTVTPIVRKQQRHVSSLFDLAE